MCHVLIIEDDAIAALDIRETLARVGATSFSFAASEREALEAARADRPALITADVMLGSSSGVVTLRKIELELGPLPAIFITGTPDQCGDSGGHPVIEKPFHPPHLAAVFVSLAPL